MVFVVAPALNVSDADFAGVELPVPILRIVTVSGSPALPRWPIVHLGQTRGAFTVSDGCGLTLERLVVTTAPGVSTSLGAAPGLDLVLARAGHAAAGGPPGLFAIREMAWTFWLCLPPEALLTAAARYVRPVELPGYQQLRLLGPASQAACADASSSSSSSGGSGGADLFPLERCWALRTEYTDVAITAVEFDASTGQETPSGYNLVAQNATSLCEQQMPRDCLQQYGLLGCYARLVAALPAIPAGGGGPSGVPTGLPAAAPPLQGRPPALVAPTQGAAGLAGGGGGSGLAGGGRLGLILGTTCGFGVLLLLALGVLLLRRRWAGGTRRAHANSSMSTQSALFEGSQQAAKMALEAMSTVEIEVDSIPSRGKDQLMGVEQLYAESPSVGVSEASPAPGSRTRTPQCAPGDSGAPITALTPPRKDFRLVRQDEELTLLPTTLGRGAFGRVAEGAYRGQRVAVKLVGAGFHESLGLAHLLSQDFVQEVEILGRCVHPNVVRLLAACLAPPRPCLVLELMEGSLERLLFEGGRGAEVLPLPKVLHIATEVARGLAYLHPTIMHRDLKPANVLLRGAAGPAPEVKIADFGLSRLRMTVVATEHPEAGTPAYMAPECFDVRNFHITHHVDMYSFGCLLYAMLSGQRPWAGMERVVIATQVTIHGRRPPLGSLPVGRCPPRLERLILACWEADPLRRPAAAEAAKLLFLMTQDLFR